MIDLEEIEREIDKVEHTCDTTYRSCERLAWLYVVRDHLRPTTGAASTQEIEGSEFLELSSGVSYPALMEIIDEHMSALAVVNRRQYDAIIEKIRALRHDV